MAVVDMPLEELKKYTGISPCPQGFNQFWNKEIASVLEIDANIELRKAQFQAPNVECFELTYTSAGGARIYAKLARPKNIDAPLPAVLEFHGYTSKSSDFSALLALAANGFVVAAMDCRGQGGKSQDIGGVSGNTLHGHIIRGLQDSPEKLLFKDVYLDCVKLANILMGFDWVNENAVATSGGSQGGALSIACAALEPKIKRCASVFPFLSDFKRIWELDIETAAYVELKEYFRHFDPTHKNEEEVFQRLGFIDIVNLAPRVKAEVLMLTTLRDNICPPSTQFAVYNNLKCKKDMIIYPDFAHENLPGSGDTIFDFFCKMA